MTVTNIRRRRHYRIACRPLCPEHGDEMEARRTMPSFTYYYCRVKGCVHSAKVPRVSIDRNDQDGDAC